jgi:hypothetical protein
MNKSSKISLVSAKKTTSGRMLGCYILCSEILVRGGLTNSKNQSLKGVRPGKSKLK